MIDYRGRKAYRLENETLRVTCLVEGGHLAELLHKPTGVNPLWTPPWPSLEPSAYDPRIHSDYGADSESKLLAGLMGHNVCLDLFGGPTEAEEAAGMTVHGEASILPYAITVEDDRLTQTVTLPHSQLRFTRHLTLASETTVEFEEAVENLAAWDRPIAWTQHVTLGPPFVQPGRTRFRAPLTRSKVFEEPFGEAAYMQTGAEFEWPLVPTLDGGALDLRTYIDRAVSGGFSTHLLDPDQDEAFFEAWSPESRVRIRYGWRRADFPWLGIWEENRSRTTPPWNGQTITRGMEFGVSPFPATRRAMIERGPLFDTPTVRWIPARETLRVRYTASVDQCGEF